MLCRFPLVWVITPMSREDYGRPACCSAPYSINSINITTNLFQPGTHTNTPCTIKHTLFWLISPLAQWGKWAIGPYTLRDKVKWESRPGPGLTGNIWLRDSYLGKKKESGPFFPPFNHPLPHPQHTNTPPSPTPPSFSPSFLMVPTLRD